MPASDWFSARTDGTSGQCTFCGFTEPLLTSQRCSGSHRGREQTWRGNQDAAYPDGEPLAQPSGWVLAAPQSQYVQPCRMSSPAAWRRARTVNRQHETRFSVNRREIFSPQVTGNNQGA
jgi:hypothetical protein